MLTKWLRCLVPALCLAAGVALAQAPGGAPAGGPPAGGPGGGGPGGGGPGGGGPGGGGQGGGGRGNFDPARFRQMMMDRMKESLGGTAEEWQVIEPRLTAVMEKQQAVRELTSFGGMRGGRGGPDQQRERPAEVTAVEKAVEGTDAAAIKAATEALRKARTAREEELTKARASLREVLSVAQEARLLLMGIMD